MPALKLKLSLYAKELVLFFLTFCATLWVSGGIVRSIATSPPPLATPDTLWPDTLWFLGIILALYLGLRRAPRFTGIALNTILLLLIFSGSHLFFGTLFSSTTALVITVVLALAFLIGRTVLIHNLALVLGLGGVAAVVGLSFQPVVLVGALVILSIYDILAVYWTRHMITFARGMVQTGAIFGFVIPFTLKDVLVRAREAQGSIGERYMILGSGDVGLPAIFIASIVGAGYSTQAVIVGIGSLVGLFITHLLFVNQSERRAMAALPPIAACSIIAYLLAQLL